MATIGSALSDAGVDTTLRLAEQGSNPATPASGYGRLFAKADGLYFIDDAGTVTGPLGAGAGGATFTTLGKNTVGASWETWTQHRFFMKKITLTTAGMLGAVEAHVKLSTADQVRSILFGLWADNAGSPRELLSYTDARSLSALWSGPAGSTNARWASGAMGRYLTAGSYWIGVGSNDTASGGHLQLAYDASGTDRYFTSGDAWTADAGFYTVTTGTNDYSIRATVLS